MSGTRASEVSAQVVGEEIGKTRQTAGLSQLELARRLDLPASYVIDAEAGRRNLTVGELARIADALDTGLRITFPIVERDQLTLRGGR